MNKEEVEEVSQEDLDYPAATIETCDLYLAYNHTFSGAAKKAFKNSVDCMNPVRQLEYPVTTSKEVEDEVKILAVTVIGEENIVKGAMHLVDIINSLALNGYVTGAMTKLSAIKMISESFELPKYIVFSYPCLTIKGSEAFDKADYPAAKLEEGDVPTVIIRG